RHTRSPCARSRRSSSPPPEKLRFPVRRNRLPPTPPTATRTACRRQTAESVPPGAGRQKSALRDAPYCVAPVLSHPVESAYDIERWREGRGGDGNFGDDSRRPAAVSRGHALVAGHAAGPTSGR